MLPQPRLRLLLVSLTSLILLAGCGDDGGGFPDASTDGGAPGDGGSCLPGYADDGAGCVDIDECMEGTDDCGASESCVNTDGGFTCDDIDECALGADDCAPSTSTCRNTDPGWACDDIDECALGTDACDDLTMCTNEDPGYSCSNCPSPYFDRHGDGTECMPHVANISHVSTTLIFPGGHSCQTASCPAGTRALGGGYEMPVSGTFDPTALHPVANGDFEVCGVASNGGSSVSVTVGLSCGFINTFIDEAFGPFYTATNSVTSGSGCATATCPAGTKAIGGGADWGSTSFQPDIMKPVNNGDAFRVCGSASAPSTIHATAICAGGDRNQNTLTATGGDMSGGCLRVDCAADHTVVSGGLNWVPADASWSSTNFWLPDSLNQFAVCMTPQSAIDWSAWSVCLPDVP